MDAARYLEDGKLTIFKRSGVYYARLRISPGKYFWRSLKTWDEQTAIRAGRRLLFQIEQRADQGLPPKSKKFSKVIDDYIRFRERDHQHGRTSDGMLRQIIRVSKFWREYAGDLAVDAIDDKVMREFIPWRRDYYSKFEKLPKNAKLHPTDKTLQWDMMLGKAIVKWASELRGSKPPITATFTPKKKRVRPGNIVDSGAHYASASKPLGTNAHLKVGSCCVTTFLYSQTLAFGPAKRTSLMCGTFIRLRMKKDAITIAL
jgi:integrase